MRTSEGLFAPQRLPQAPLQFRAQLGDDHTLADQELAGQQRAGFVVIGQLASDAAILAFLIPAEAAIRNCFRADELEAAQERVLLRHLDLLAEYFNFDQALVRAEEIGHRRSAADATIAAGEGQATHLRLS